jgi:ATP-binding cassette subfamily B protein
MYSVNLFFTIAFAITSMLIMNPTLTMWALIPLPVLSVIIYFVNELVEKASTRIQAKLSDMTTDAQETYSGIRVVQAYVREK